MGSWEQSKCSVCGGDAIAFSAHGGGTHYRHAAGADSRFHWAAGGSSPLYLVGGSNPHAGRVLHVVEGQTDAETLHAVGLPVAGVLGSGQIGKALALLDELGLLRDYAEIIVWRERGTGGTKFVDGARASMTALGFVLRVADWPLDVDDARDLLAKAAAAHRVRLSDDDFDGALSHLKLCAVIGRGDERVAPLRLAVRERLDDITRDAPYLGAAQVEVIDTPTATVVANVEIPPGHRVTDRMGVQREDDEGRWATVIPTPLLIEAVEIDAHEGSERLALRWKSRGRDRRVSVPREVAASARRIVDVAAQGLPVTSENARKVVQWLHLLEHFSPPATATVARRAGWAMGRHLHAAEDMSLDDGTGSARLLSGLQARGEAEESLAFVRRVVEYHPMAACMCAASLAAALLSPVGLRGFALHLWGDSRGGKALDLDTPLPTPTGWTTMGEVATGDTLIDERGNPCRVTKAHDVLHGRDCYEVEFSDGEIIVADGEHLWQTSSNRERIASVRRTPEWRARRQATRGRSKGSNPAVALANALRAKEPVTSSVRTTVEIAAAMAIGERHAVDVAQPLALPPADLPIDPYILGVWLGDGTSSKGSITTSDPEIVQSFCDAGYDPRKIADKWGWGTRGLFRPLRLAGLLGNKHIPAAYLRASVDQRIALLQGIVDSDGHIDERGQVEICLTRKPLMDGIHELLLSLGIKCRVRESRATIDGRDCGPRWRVKFMTDLPAARLPRKLDRQKRSGFKGSHARRYIVSIRPVESRPVRCVTVDSPSRLYLAGRAMIPTHNTAALKLALSLWGDPIRLMGSWSATANAIEAHAATLCDLPTALDELQAAKSVEHVAQTIYALANGVGRARATVTGDLGTQRQWRTVVMTTGEMPLLPEDAHDGARTRTIDIHAAPFAGERAGTDAAVAHDISERAYGWIGPAMMRDSILSPGASVLLRDEIDEATGALREKLGARAADVPPIKLRSAGAMVWALQWLGRHVGATDAQSAVDVVAAMLAVATDQAREDDSYGSPTWKAANAILDLIAERPDAFNPNVASREVLGSAPTTRAGELDIDSGTAYLTTRGMREACTRAGVPYAKARALLHAAGVIDGSQASPRRGVMAQPVRCFAVSLDKIGEVPR